MEIRINELELKLLAYLHENARGYGYDHHYRVGSPDETLAVPFEATREELLKAASYLSGWKMIVMGHSGGVEPKLQVLWLTERGEAYMREVEHRLAEQQAIPAGQRLGVAVLGHAMSFAMNVAAGVATEYVKLRLMGGGA